MNTWIKWTKGLVRKPEILQIARKLRITSHEAAARCMVVWEWADESTEDGVVMGAGGGTIDEIAGLEGFAAAMAATIPTPWIVVDEDWGCVIFEKFTRHNGDSAKKRAQDAERQARLRHARSVTKVTDTPLPEKRRGRGREQKDGLQGGSSVSGNVGELESGSSRVRAREEGAL